MATTISNTDLNDLLDAALEDYTYDLGGCHVYAGHGAHRTMDENMDNVVKSGVPLVSAVTYGNIGNFISGVAGVVGVAAGTTCRLAAVTVITAQSITMDMGNAVWRLAQRRDDDIATDSLDMMETVDSSIVPDDAMAGAALVAERAAEETKPTRFRRRRWQSGKYLLVKLAQSQFPNRLDGPNRALVSRQVYEFMLRRANALEWSVQDKADLPALAALAMTPGAGDCEARKVLNSRLAEELASEYEVSGSRYPNAKRLFRRLKFWA